MLIVASFTACPLLSVLGKETSIFSHNMCLYPSLSTISMMLPSFQVGWVHLNKNNIKIQIFTRCEITLHFFHTKIVTVPEFPKYAFACLVCCFCLCFCFHWKWILSLFAGSGNFSVSFFISFMDVCNPILSTTFLSKPQTNNLSASRQCFPTTLFFIHSKRLLPHL